MTEGICTERDWRRNGGGIRYAAQPCWGAAYVRTARRRSIHRNSLLHAGMLLCSLAVSVAMSVCFQQQPVPMVFPMASAPVSAEALHIRTVQGLSFTEPVGVGMGAYTYTAEQLYRGRLLLLDAEHPLPEVAPVPSTVTIATYGKGMVPVNDLSLKCGKETILALSSLFQQLREAGAGAFTVWQGTTTRPQREAALSAHMRKLVEVCSLEEAARISGFASYSPELQQPYTVELRMPGPVPALPDETPLEETVAGRQLLRAAWRNGFVRTQASGEAAFLFRYVGRAHATAMTYLNVGLKEYLTILHQKRHLTIHDADATYYIQCVPAEGAYAVFTVPTGAVCEASMDNTGYAVIACTLPRNK